MKKSLSFIGSFNIAVMAAIFLVILLPIPVILLDILIALNILLALFLLANTVMAKRFEDNSLLPTMLLGLVILNLATTIAVTRVILTKGPEFDGLLIGFIASLGATNGMSSFIPHYILTFGCFCVMIMITAKGATRVAEVAARFTLDKMPIRLLAIEHELESKAITKEEADAKKNAINEESDFYGTLDAVSKFISGNARLFIIIVFITIAAGIFLGTKFRDEELSEAIITYLSLAMSSGFFAVIPTFILSTTTGVAINKLFSNNAV